MKNWQIYLIILVGAIILLIGFSMPTGRCAYGTGLEQQCTQDVAAQAVAFSTMVGGFVTLVSGTYLLVFRS